MNDPFGYALLHFLRTRTVFALAIIDPLTVAYLPAIALRGPLRVRAIGASALATARRGRDDGAGHDSSSNPSGRLMLSGDFTAQITFNGELGHSRHAAFSISASVRSLTLVDSVTPVACAA